MKSTKVFSVVPFKQVGPLKFGMSRAEVFTILGPFDRERKAYTGGIIEIRVVYQSCVRVSFAGW